MRLTCAKSAIVMSEEILSVLMQCRADAVTHTLHVQIVNVDTGEAVSCSDSAFLLRMTVDRQLATVRCLIRHIASGDEAHVQSGLNILAFMRMHLLNSQDAEQSSTKKDVKIDKED